MTRIDKLRPQWRRAALATSVLLSLGSLGTTPAWSQSATARDAGARTYHIRAQALGAALQELAAQAGLQLLFSETDVAGLKVAGLDGAFSTEQALARLLAGSGLTFESPKADVVIVRRAGGSGEGGSHPRAMTDSPSPIASAAAPMMAAAASDGSPAATRASDALQLDEVIVTGRSGIEQRTKASTSYSVTNIDEQRLRMQAPTSVTEALKSVPGFWVESSGGEASGNVRARGIPVDGFGSITLLEDGMPVQHDPALGYLNGDQVFRLDETIERVEVVRGGPSSIFYSNAPAGAVNFIPRRVGDHADGILKYTVGDYGLNRIDAWFGAPVGDWKLSMGGFYRYDSGIRNPGFRADDGGQFRISLSRELERGRVSFDIKHMDDIVALYLGIPMRTYPDGKIRAVPGFDGNYGTIAGPETSLVRMKTADGSDFIFDNTKGTHVARTQATAMFEFDLDDHLEFSDRLRFNDTNTQRNGVFPNAIMSATSWLNQSAGLLANYPGATALQLRYNDSPSTVFDVTNQNGNGLMIIGGLRSVSLPVREVMNDARLMRKFEFAGQTHDITLGYYVAKADETFTRYSSTALLDVRNNSRLLDMVAVDPTGKVLGTLTDNGIWRYGYEWENDRGQSTSNAVYLSDEWQVTDRLRIDAGIRREEVHVTGTAEEQQQVSLGTQAATSEIWTGTGVFDHFDRSFHKLGWTIGANWQFNSHSGLFARYTPTFRLPNLSNFIDDPFAKSVIQTMDLGEIGYKYANELLDVYATGFWTKYNNVGFSNYVFNPQSGASTLQAGYADTRAYGLELEGGVYPIEWFDVSFNATLEQPQYEGLRYTQLVNGSPVLRDYVGNQLIRVPKVSMRIVPGLNLFNRRLRIQASWEYEGNRYVDTANSVRLPAYQVVNASARLVMTDHLDLYGYVDNLTNSLGLTEGNPRAGELQSADAGANTFIARPVLGRNYRFALMYRF